MEIARSYKLYIVENKNLVFISVVISLLIRLCIYYTSDIPVQFENTGGYLWSGRIVEFLSGSLISMALSFVFTLAIVFYSAILNTKHKLIRSRTYLIYVFTSLLLSSHPIFVYMGSQYITLLIILACIDILLSSYQQVNASGKAYSIGFLLAFASLFSFNALMYIPVFWIGLRLMRCFNFKTFITFALGLATVYWLAFFYFVWDENIQGFTRPFEHIYPILSKYITQLNYSKVVQLSICGLLLITVTINYLTRAFHDKIQTRTNLTFFYTITIFSFLAFIFVCYDPILNLYILMASGSILLSHFFTLTEQKWKIYLFYILYLYILLSAFISS